MRSIVAACAAALVLTACSGGGSEDDSDADPRPIDDVCALLSVDDASRIVGVPYADATVLSPGAPIELCSYEQAVIEGPFILSVSAGPGDLDDVAVGLRMAGEVTQEPIEVAGAEEAAVLATNDGDVSVEQVAAEADGNIYVVTFGGASEVAARMLAAILGEDVPDHPGEPVADACGIDGRAITDALGAGVAPAAEAAEEAWSSCTWDDNAGTSVTLSIARDAGDLERYLVEHAYVPDGVEPEVLSLPGADDARLVDDPEAAISSATGVATADGIVYEIEVTDAHGRAGAIATDLLAVSIGSS